MKAYDGAKPSVGRIVHFYPNTADDDLNKVPHAAIITYVDFTEIEVDVYVFVPSRFKGYSQNFSGVPFSENPKPGHWTWPPRV